ncbi:IS3 family transposase, partial [Catenibacterium mitsuokai]
RKPSESSKRRESVKKEISRIHEESHEIYGAPKITEELKKKGHVISEKTVGNYMHEMHIKAHYIKPWTKTTVSKNFSNRLRNILKRDFDPASPDAAWCTDITYIWTYDDGFVYLTSVMDLFSRKIISWVLTKDMTAESV